MALNRLEAGIVTRGKGQSVIARAAYNSREKLIDERTGTAKDYRYLGEPVWQGIFAPDHAPDWARDRQQLWNAVERREDESTRPDSAQLARDLKIALPHELNEEQRRNLTQEFAEYLTQKGMVVDVAIHPPDAKGDERNYHAHMLLTMRSITPDGFGNKVREWNRDSELLEWRDRWSEIGAEHLRAAGLELEADRFRVGHLTLQRQREDAIKRGDLEWAEALDRTPTHHLGPEAAAMEKQGKLTRKGDLNHEIEERNQERSKERGLSRTDGEIRLAYQLTERAQAFADALEDRGLILARVGEGDLPKLAALDARRSAENRAEHERKLDYLDRRITGLETTGDSNTLSELKQRRERLEKDYAHSLPWMKREGGSASLGENQRQMAMQSYRAWHGKARHGFEDYVAYVQEQWRDNPAGGSRFTAGDLVVIDPRGDVYRITERNTGDDPRVLRKYLREIDTAPLFSVAGAWEVLRAVHDVRNEEKRVPAEEKHWPIHPPSIVPENLPKVLDHLNNVNHVWGRAAMRLVRNEREHEVPEELQRARSYRFPEASQAAVIRGAVIVNRHDPNAFVDALSADGMALCQVTKSEADHSRRNAAFSREIGHFSRTYREGEIVVMGSNAYIYRFNEKTTGLTPEQSVAFLRKLDRATLPTLKEATDLMHERAESREAVAQLMSAMYPLHKRPAHRRGPNHLRKVVRAIRGTASSGMNGLARTFRLTGRLAELGVGTLESLFSPVITPTQRRAGEIASKQRELEGEEAERRRRAREMER